MPYKKTEASEVYEFEEYPKMYTVKGDDGVIKPQLYPTGHEKQGLPVIFENADEEAAYSKPKAPKKKVEKDDK